jgi:hypothetical protein
VGLDPQWIVAIALLINAVVGIIGLWQIRVYHLKVNSRLDQLLKLKRKSGFAAGVRNEQNRHR